MTLNRLGFTLSASAAVVCAVLHAATFVTVVPGFLIIPPFFLFFAAIVCLRATQPFTFSGSYSIPAPSGKYLVLGLILLAYSLACFVYFFRTMGDVTSVGIVDGQYVSMHKDHVIHTITEHQYRMFPIFVVRMMSAWIAMIAVFSLSSFPPRQAADHKLY